MRIQIIKAKTTKCETLPEATGKIFLTITHMRMHILLCLLRSENSEFQV